MEQVDDYLIYRLIIYGTKNADKCIANNIRIHATIHNAAIYNALSTHPQIHNSWTSILYSVQ